MTREEATEILNRMCKDGEKRREKVVSIHLFGILYADQIRDLPIEDIVKYSDVSPKYATEVRKGIALSRYVQLRSNTKGIVTG